jgi:DNA-binding LacI/PurR family transcriptional regulator
MVDRGLNIPLYIQIYNDLKEQILQNEYKDEYLPSERILSEKYNVERATLRRALNLLVDDNLLIKMPGSGSKVNRDLLEKPIKMSKLSNNIAFILPAESSEKIYQPFTAALFYDFEKECQAHNYNLFYTNVKSEEDLYERVFKADIKGIVWISKVNDIFIQKANEFNIPSVCISNYVPGINSILCDNSVGSHLAIDHLINLGHRKIGYINGISSYLNATERFTGYIGALNQYGYEYDSSLVRDGDWTFESGYETAMDLIKSVPEITAIYAANDMMALGAIKAVQQYGKDVPKDISIVGFDNINQGKYFSPALTTIQVNIKIFAKETLKALNRSIEDDDSPALKILIPTNLVIRESTKKLRG